jgi:hypothetical protein
LTVGPSPREGSFIGAKGLLGRATPGELRDTLKACPANLLGQRRRGQQSQNLGRPLAGIFGIAHQGGIARDFGR